MIPAYSRFGFCQIDGEANPTLALSSSASQVEMGESHSSLVRLRSSARKEIRRRAYA